MFLLHLLQGEGEAEVLVLLHLLLGEDEGEVLVLLQLLQAEGEGEVEEAEELSASLHLGLGLQGAHVDHLELIGSHRVPRRTSNLSHPWGPVYP